MPRRFFWNEWNYVRDEWEIHFNIHNEETGGFSRKTICAAPTADEILDKLPGKISIIINGHSYDIWLEITIECNDEWEIAYEGARHIELYDKCIADAAAKMWLYLKKEGLI